MVSYEAHSKMHIFLQALVWCSSILTLYDRTISPLLLFSPSLLQLKTVIVFFGSRFEPEIKACVPVSWWGWWVAAVSDHHRNQFCKACRTHLHVAMSNDEGVSWRYIAHIDREEENGVRIHYPTLLEHGDSLYVIYSRQDILSDRLLCYEISSARRVSRPQRLGFESR